jgi:hypothetical protein
MRIDGPLISRIMQFLHGRVVLDTAEAVRLCTLLQTRDELVAWLLLQSRVSAELPSVSHALQSVALSSVVSPATPCKRGRFPIATRKAALELETAMRDFLHANEGLATQARHLHECVARSALRGGDGRLAIRGVLVRPS